MSTNFNFTECWEIKSSVHVSRRANMVISDTMYRTGSMEAFDNLAHRLDTRTLPAGRCFYLVTRPQGDQIIGSGTREGFREVEEFSGFVGSIVAIEGERGALV